MSLNPIRVLKNEADEEKAETARLSSFVGAMAVGDLVKSTLGPKVRLVYINANSNETIIEDNFNRKMSYNTFLHFRVWIKFSGVWVVMRDKLK